jgi:hypothetical protein
VDDILLDDGSGQIRRSFVVESSLGRFEIPADQFDAMNWVPRAWGARAIITPSNLVRQHLAAAIKSLSPPSAERRIYQHLGWRKIDGQLLYLHAGGAIGAEGLANDIEVQPDLLGAFKLPQVRCIRDATQASLATLKLARPSIGYALMGAIYRAPLAEFCPVDLSLFLTGPTGAFKTATALIAQAHWGCHTRPPANWASTANALERLAFLAKDAVLLVDDYAPAGGTAEISRLQGTAARLLRSQGNRVGRHRMNSDGSLRPEMYPRGLIIATGEDSPTGQSIIARTAVLEIDPSDIETAALTTAQRDAEHGLLAMAMAGYLEWLARQAANSDLGPYLAERQRQLRDVALGEHRRTPANVASLMLGIETLFRFTVEAGVLSAAEEEAHVAAAWKALASLAQAQASFIQSEKPADRFILLIAAALLSGRAHIRGLDGGPPEAHWPALGWREASSLNARWEPQGKAIGWICGDNLYLNPEAAYAAAQELARASNRLLATVPKTLWKRLQEAGMLVSQDDERHTVRITAAGQRQRILHLSASQALGLGES